jgi:N-ethylmaleimide reductase
VALFGAKVDYHAMLRPRFDGTFLIGSGLTQDSAEELVAEGKADAVVFGSAFLANPGLPERFRVGAALNAPDHRIYFSPPTAQGYIDYPSLTTA